MDWRGELVFTIKIGQELEVDNMLSYRGCVSQSELELIGQEMELLIKQAGAKRVANPITATFGIEGNSMDMELLLPVNKRIESNGKFGFKDKLKLMNAVKLE